MFFISKLFFFVSNFILFPANLLIFIFIFLNLPFFVGKFSFSLAERFAHKMNKLADKNVNFSA